MFVCWLVSLLESNLFEAMEYNVQDEYDTVGNGQPSLGQCFLVSIVIKKFPQFMESVVRLLR